MATLSAGLNSNSFNIFPFKSYEGCPKLSLDNPKSGEKSNLASWLDKMAILGYSHFKDEIEILRNQPGHEPKKYSTISSTVPRVTGIKKLDKQLHATEMQKRASIIMDQPNVLKAMFSWIYSNISPESLTELSKCSSWIYSSPDSGTPTHSAADPSSATTSVFLDAPQPVDTNTIAPGAQHSTAPEDDDWDYDDQEFSNKSFTVKGWKDLCDSLDTRSLLLQINRTHLIAQSGLPSFDRYNAHQSWHNLKCPEGMEPNTFLQSFNTEYQRWISSDVDYNTMRTETLVVKFLFCLSASNPKYDTLIQTVKNDALRNRVPLPSTVAAAAQLAQHWSVQPVSGHRETTFLSEDQLLKFEEKIMKK